MRSFLVNYPFKANILRLPLGMFHLEGKINYYMVFAYKCVLAVCGDNHPIMIKFHLLPPTKKNKKLNSLNYQAVLIFWAVWLHTADGVSGIAYLRPQPVVPNTQKNGRKWWGEQ